MSYTNYARLGQSCQTSLDVLVDNRKFFPIDDPVYEIFYTRMQHYPLATEINPTLSKDVQRPEDIKTARQNIQQPETFKSGCGSCGGKK